MSASVSRITVALYAPAMPRSEAMSRTATRLVSERSASMGCETVECVASADTARVIARA